jgi:hypothetical protein
LKEVPLALLRARESEESKVERALFDLGFLELVPDKGRSYRHIIDEHRISLIICGRDHYRWAAYDFTDSASQQEDDSNDYDDDEADGDVEESDDDESAPSEDVLAANAGFVLFEDRPIWDPRTYFLVLVEGHIRMTEADWLWLVHHLERSVKSWVCSAVLRSIL